MRNYELDATCPICQHPQQEKVDARLERQALANRPGGAFGYIASLFEDMSHLDAVHHERAHRNPNSHGR